MAKPRPDLTAMNRTPEARQRSRENVQRWNESPEGKRNSRESGKRIGSYWQTPEGRARRSELSRRPEHLAKLAEARAARTAESFAKIRAALDAWNASPEGKASALKGLAIAHAEWADKVRDPDYEPRPIMKSRIPALRKRDGDDCKICFTRIEDFDLPWPHPLSPSVDHVMPVRAGGSHRMDNLQLSHLVCNHRKGARPGWTCATG